MFAAKDTLFTRPSGYTISRSVRFRSSATAYFNRTFAAAGNQQKFTYSFWTKRGTLGSVYIASSGWSGSGATQGAAEFAFNGDAIQVDQQSNNAYDWRVVTTPVYRDPSAWYHIVLAVDTTQATAANRVIVYVNGVQITSYSTASYPTQNSNTKFNATNQRIGSTDNGGSPYVTYDGYMTEFNFIDGQALTPSSFGSTNAITGVWQPKKYSGSYGTNGFYLNFSDNSASTATTIGKDYSDNGNNWTPNNISVTAGVTYDSMIDVPTPYADGGTGRGNYAVLSPIVPTGSAVISGGNLNINSVATYCNGLSTIALDSGAYYAECVVTTHAAEGWGVWDLTKTAASNTGATPSGFYGIYSGGATLMSNGSNVATNAAGTPANGDTVQVAWSNGNVWVGKNNTWYNSTFGTTGNPSTGANPTFTGLTVDKFAIIFGSGNAAVSLSANFGQRSFTYTPPTGFKALNTYNLPSSTISNGATYMNVLTWSGTGGSAGATRALTGLNFKPDFVWEKNRTSTQDHHLFDSVRGAGTNKTLASNSTGAEGGFNDTLYGYLSSFDSGGVTTTNGSSTWDNWNKSGDTFVAWCWNAGSGSSSSNTSGSITSTVSVNATAGFSVVTYTGTGTTGTVGHGLGVVPNMIIVKERNRAVEGWLVYTTTTGNANALFLNTTGASSAVGAWNSTTPTSTVFTVGGASAANLNNTTTYVAYCWAAVAGFSKFGSYTGNGSTDGPFVYCGFRPRYIMVKQSSASGQSWQVEDTSREPYNSGNRNVLFPDLQSLEIVDAYPTDILSNGFKPRNAGNGNNQSGQTYIYAAFAENPFKNALAR